MKAIILSQKNVWAFIAVIMALTIVFSASAEAKVDTLRKVSLVEKHEVLKMEEGELKAFDLQLEDIKSLPTITFINKYGEVIAEFYGEKKDLEKRFAALFEKGEFITSSGKHEFYLVK